MSAPMTGAGGMSTPMTGAGGMSDPMTGAGGMSTPMTGTVRLDLNADLGESLGTWQLGDDEAMLDIVTSANVACGFHAGDSLTLRRTCAQAAERGVVVGAQVGYRDLVGFGRRFIDMDADELTADVIYQIGALEDLCRVAGTRVEYAKPHGALYPAGHGPTGLGPVAPGDGCRAANRRRGVRRPRLHPCRTPRLPA